MSTKELRPGETKMMNERKGGAHVEPTQVSNIRGQGKPVAAQVNGQPRAEGKGSERDTTRATRVGAFGRVDHLLTQEDRDRHLIKTRKREIMLYKREKQMKKRKNTNQIRVVESRNRLGVLEMVRGRESSGPWRGRFCKLNQKRSFDGRIQPTHRPYWSMPRQRKAFE